MMLEESYQGNVLFSGYYHASDNVNLIVNNQLMSYLPSGISFYSEFREMKDGTNIADALLNKMFRSIRETISFENRGKKVSVRKSQSKRWETVDEGDSYSLFGILTDCMGEIDEQTVFTTMADAVEDMPWIDDNAFIYNTNSNAISGTPIVPLGNYRANQVAVTSLAGNVFSVLALPNYGMDIEEITKKIEANDSREHRRIDIYSEVLLALKRNVTISS